MDGRDCAKCQKIKKNDTLGIIRTNFCVIDVNLIT